MSGFLHRADGRFRALRLGAVLYVLNGVLSGLSKGWISPWTAGWWLMAVGFWTADGERGEGRDWNAPSVVAMFLGVACLLFGVAK